MALSNFSSAHNIVTVNGRQITDWGEGDPILEEPIDPKTALRRGHGGNAVRLDRINPGRRVTLNLNPGSPDSAYMQGLLNSRVNITYTRHVTDTMEIVTASEGAIVNDGPQQRGGMTISDDQYVMEFNVWEASKGGSY